MLSKISSVSPVGSFNKTLTALLNENNIQINSEEEFNELFPDLSNSTRYLEMMERISGTEEFVKRVEKLVNNRETALNKDIGILGDYDVDGIMGTVILMTLFSDLGFNVYQHIPNRLTDGYGLTKKLAESPKALNAQLLITTDTGISEKDVIDLLKRSGQPNIIVTDHHLPDDETVPEDVLIIDPKYNNDKFKDICGACVALKLAHAVYQHYNMETPDVLVAFAGIATIADMMPMLGENRVLVKEALSLINKTKFDYDETLSPVFQLLKNLGGSKWLSSTELATVDLISFFIAPNINAISRTSGNVNGFVRELFNSIEYGTGYPSYVSKNITRRNNTLDLIQKFEFDENSEVQIALFNESDFSFPIKGLTGIVANKISNSRNRVALAGHQRADGTYDFSGRGIPGYNLYEGIMRISKDHPELGITGGGHASAMGIKISSKLDNALDIFKDLLNEDVKNNKTKISSSLYEFEEELEEEIISTLKYFEPYGQSFKPLTFQYTGLFSKYSATNAHIGDFNFRYFATKEEQQLVGSNITVNFQITFENPNAVTFKCQKGGD